MTNVDGVRVRIVVSVFGSTNKSKEKKGIDMEHIESKILDLPLKAKWYLMQESGEKTEEYRGITPYWCNRLLEQDSSLGIKYWQVAVKKAYEFDKEGICPLEKLTSNFELKKYTHVRFRYGYTKRTFTHKIDSITIGFGKTEWGAPTDRKVFIIKHHKEE